MSDSSHACFCIGPQNGEPMCPCRMRASRGQHWPWVNKINNPDNLPVIPPLPPQRHPAHDGAVAICGECGRRVGRVEGYACSNGRCPVQPKSVSINSTGVTS